MADTTSLTLVCQGVAGSSPVRPQRIHEFGEVRQRVVRAGSGLGMILHGEQRELAVANSLDGAVVQIEMSYFERCCARDTAGISNHREAMVLSGNQHLIRPHIANR